MNQSQSKAKLFIAPFVYACHTNDGVVFLDLVRNKYVGISAADASSLTGIVDDWAKFLGNASLCTSPLPNHDSVAQDLIANGLLTAEHDPSRCFPSMQISVTGDLVSIGEELISPARIHVHHVRNFISACVIAKFALRLEKLQSIALWLRGRRSKHKPETHKFNLIQATELVCVFRRLRPFVFTAGGQCLFHALALTIFLSNYRLYPSWVMGVRTKPWGAHSWVQHDNYVLDTTPEKVFDYTPILAI
jgi:hypothetical protein